MTFRELLNKCLFKSVFNKIRLLYYMDKSNTFLMEASCGYRKAYDALCQKKKNPNNDWKIYLTEKEIYPEECDGGKYIDVCYLNNEEDEIYSIDFVPWEDLIDLEIHNCAKMDDTTALAHILWEITFWGFSDSAINKEKKLLDEASKETITDFDLDKLD